MFIARTTALGWARDEDRWEAVAHALRHSSLSGVDSEVEVEVFESDVDEVYVNQMGSVRIDAEDVPEDAPDGYDPLEKIDTLTLSAEEADLLGQLLDAAGRVKTDAEGLIRESVKNSGDAGLYRDSIERNAKEAAAASADLKEVRS